VKEKRIDWDLNSSFLFILFKDLTFPCYAATLQTFISFTHLQHHGSSFVCCHFHFQVPLKTAQKCQWAFWERFSWMLKMDNKMSSPKIIFNKHDKTTDWGESLFASNWMVGRNFFVFTGTWHLFLFFFDHVWGIFLMFINFITKLAAVECVIS